MIHKQFEALDIVYLVKLLHSNLFRLDYLSGVCQIHHLPIYTIISVLHIQVRNHSSVAMDDPTVGKQYCLRINH